MVGLLWPAAPAAETGKRRPVPTAAGNSEPRRYLGAADSGVRGTRRTSSPPPFPASSRDKTPPRVPRSVPTQHRLAQCNHGACSPCFIMPRPSYRGCAPPSRPISRNGLGCDGDARLLQDLAPSPARFRRKAEMNRAGVAHLAGPWAPTGRDIGRDRPLLCDRAHRPPPSASAGRAISSDHDDRRRLFGIVLGTARRMSRKLDHR